MARVNTPSNPPLDNFHDWADRAKPGSRITYFVTRDPWPNQDGKSPLFRAVRKQYEQRRVFLSRKRRDGETSYIAERCNRTALTRIEAVGKRA